jgi:hypothetical protein
VLTEGGHRSHDGRLPGYLDGWQERGDVASGGVHLAPPAAGVQLGMTGELLRGAQPRAGDPGGLKRPAGLLCGQRGEGFLDDGGQLVVVRDAVGIGGEAGVCCQGSLPEDVAAEDDPFPFVLDPEEDRTVGDLERAVRRDGRMPCPGSPGWLCAVAGKVGGLHGQLAQRVEHRYLDGRAVAGVFPVVQRGQDAAECVHAGRDVSDRDPRLGRDLGSAGRHNETGLALDQQVVRLLHAVGAIWAVAGDRAVDQPLPARPQRRRAEAEPLGPAGGQVLHEHVRPVDEPAQQRPAGVVLEVENDGLLAPVQPHEIGRLAVYGLVVATREVAPVRPFDLDYPRAEVGELPGGEGGGDGLLEGDDEDALQSVPHQIRFLLMSWRAMTLRWISLVPSPTIISGASRKYRSTSNSVE